MRRLLSSGEPIAMGFRLQQGVDVWEWFVSSFSRISGGVLWCFSVLLRTGWGSTCWLSLQKGIYCLIH